MTFDPFDVVIVPFPFTDRAQSKKRPALVLSENTEFNQKSGHSIMAMITSAKNSPWPLDVTVSDLSSAGLPAPSVVRMKLFTLDNRFVLSKLGALSPKDQKLVSQSLKKGLSRILSRS